MALPREIDIMIWLAKIVLTHVPGAPPPLVLVALVQTDQSHQRCEQNYEAARVTVPGVPTRVRVLRWVQGLGISIDAYFKLEHSDS